MGKQHLNRFISKGFKAEKASEKAQASGKRSDHIAAMKAHTEAAQSANQAGVDRAHAIHHRSQASAHSAMADVAKKSGSFGTDPATGNPQSKAKVLDPRLGPVHRSELKGGSRIAGPMKGEPGFQGRSRASENKHRNIAETASAKADAASHNAKTFQEHSHAQDLHHKASTEWGNRFSSYTEPGKSKVQHHEQMQQHHAEGARTAPDHPAKRKLHPTNLGAKVTPQVPAMKGTAPMGHTIPGAKGNMNDGGRVGARDPVRQRLDKAMRSLHPTYDTTKKPPTTPAGSAAKAHAEALSAKANAHPSPAAHRAAGDAHYKASQYGENDGRHHISTGNAHYAQGKAAYAKAAGTTPNKVGGGKTTAVGPHVPGHPDYTHAKGASHHAHTQTAKALAKPSLASHSIAAKAHTQAASAHAHGSPEHQKHLSEATFHRTAASNFSHKIMKLKKLGPGQHHGRGGRFEGTPGGAK